MKEGKEVMGEERLVLSSLKGGGGTSDVKGNEHRVREEKRERYMLRGEGKQVM